MKDSIGKLHAVSAISADRLIAALPQVTLYNWQPLVVRHIQCDSRAVQPGDMFVAYSGVSVDGHRFVSQARRAGAVAFVVERMLPELAGVPTAVVPNGREAFAHLHAALRGYPARQLKVIGITGTDGKTTTTRLIASILEAAGRRVGRIDTVGATIGGRELDTGFHTTTPDAPEVQGYLAEMVAAGMEYALIESTSHGLAQHRVTACEYDVAVVTNITHEHLDVHGTYEAYREAKAMLFRALRTTARKAGQAKIAVLNADDSSYAYLRPIPADVQLAYGLREAADITAHEVVATPEGLQLVAQTPAGEVALVSPLVGQYNVYNILAAVSVAHALGVAPEATRAGVAAMRGISGRMERIHQGQPFTAIVDFAHTPNALENALSTVRGLTQGRVIVVFGCAGLRDRAKRAWMGEVAGRLADYTIITAEDPRTEPLEEIMAEIARGCQRAGRAEGRDYRCMGDRGEGIAAALSMAVAGDLVMVTGKGHERSMCFGTTEVPWSDQEAVGRGLVGLGYV
jgi:UDP-N-acetylmuramoyl-L-alanyl-D-glutamate--2,6-diaminopimelate ligase